MTQITLFHASIDCIQVLAYSTQAEVQDQQRRIVLATTSNGLDINYGMSVVLARAMARALMLASDAPHRPSLDRYEERCLEFFGGVQGGYVRRDNELDPEQRRAGIQLALFGGHLAGEPKATLSLTEPRARSLAAALLSATESVIAESTVKLAAQMPPSAAECRKQRQPDGWPGDADDIAEAAEREAVLADTLAATPLEEPIGPASIGNGGW